MSETTTTATTVPTPDAVPTPRKIETHAWTPLAPVAPAGTPTLDSTVSKIVDAARASEDALTLFLASAVETYLVLQQGTTSATKIADGINRATKGQPFRKSKFLPTTTSMVSDHGRMGGFYLIPGTLPEGVEWLNVRTLIGRADAAAVETILNTKTELAPAYRELLAAARDADARRKSTGKYAPKPAEDKGEDDKGDKGDKGKAETPATPETPEELSVAMFRLGKAAVTMMAAGTDAGKFWENWSSLVDIVEGMRDVPAETREAIAAA